MPPCACPELICSITLPPHAAIAAASFIVTNGMNQQWLSQRRSTLYPTESNKKILKLRNCLTAADEANMSTNLSQSDAMQLARLSCLATCLCVQLLRRRAYMENDVVTADARSTYTVAYYSIGGAYTSIHHCFTEKHEVAHVQYERRSYLETEQCRYQRHSPARSLSCGRTASTPAIGAGPPLVALSPALPTMKLPRHPCLLHATGSLPCCAAECTCGAAPLTPRVDNANRMRTIHSGSTAEPSQAHAMAGSLQAPSTSGAPWRALSEKKQ